MTAAAESSVIRPIERMETALANGHNDAPVAENAIDGVPLPKLVWVRTSGGEDFGRDNGVPVVNIRSTSEALKKLEDWAKADGQDTSAVTLNLRNSLHGALNHQVVSHAFGDWDDKPFAIVAPVQSLTSANGAPASLNTVDTWWTLPANGGLKVPDATLIAPDREGKVPAGQSSVRNGDTVYYTTKFDDASEAAITSRLSPGAREKFLETVNEKLERVGEVPAHAGILDQARVERSPAVNDAIDAELGRRMKVLVTNEAISAHGPVRTGGMWGWERSSYLTDSQDIERQTRTVAAAIGSEMQQHNGSVEDQAVTEIEKGLAKHVVTMADISPATRQFAQHLSENPGYKQFARAKQVDRELGLIAAGLEPASTITAAAAERLAIMSERARAGNPMPNIQPTNEHGSPSGKPLSMDTPRFSNIVAHAERAHATNFDLVDRLAEVPRHMPDTAPVQAYAASAPPPPPTSAVPPPIPASARIMRTGMHG